MILESDDERNAFKYVCELASMATDMSHEKYYTILTYYIG